MPRPALFVVLLMIVILQPEGGYLKFYVDAITLEKRTDQGSYSPILTGLLTRRLPLTPSNSLPLSY
jgi:hypothetical protein